MTDQTARMKEVVDEGLAAHIRELEAENRALKDELASYRRGERHVIELRDDGWTIQHPLSCRPNLFDCIVNFAAMKVDDLYHRPSGRYYCTVDNDKLVVEEAVN